ncbi:MAG: hypothetical protein JO020_24995 [Chloroflexi bacterium]|nr:hypothetical protein [Chloroflexota bacterium]MBV9132927.1 hypothetical protein [Chloroflexota bacterium]MBV9897430.1 hypothetical protein [Chloroflexota bacterium]
MEEILGILGFSFGASMGIGVVRSVVGGSRPVLRDVLKMGIRAWDGVAGAAAAARDDAAPTAEPAAPRAGRRRAAPQKILIAHE